MKLRNKKTGEVVDAFIREKRKVDKYSTVVCSLKEYKRGRIDRSILGEYASLAELNEEWEDYKSAEPLIKDEDKLDTVKSFFLMLGIIKDIYYQPINNCFYHTDDDGISYSIDFVGDKGIENLCIGIPYALAELCGEEEEC